MQQEASCAISCCGVRIFFFPPDQDITFEAWSWAILLLAAALYLQALDWDIFFLIKQQINVAINE